MDRALRYGRRGCEFKSYFVYSHADVTQWQSAVLPRPKLWVQIPSSAFMTHRGYVTSIREGFYRFSLPTL